MRKLQEQLKDRETTLKQEESFVRQLDADNEELRTFKKLEVQEASSKKDEHSSSNSSPNSSLAPGSILFPSFGEMQGVVGIVPQPTWAHSCHTCVMLQY